MKGVNKFGRLGAPIDVAAMLLSRLAGKDYREIGRLFNVSATCAMRRIKSHAIRVGVAV